MNINASSLRTLLDIDRIMHVILACWVMGITLGCLLSVEKSAKMIKTAVAPPTTGVSVLSAWRLVKYRIHTVRRSTDLTSWRGPSRRGQRRQKVFVFGTSGPPHWSAQTATGAT